MLDLFCRICHEMIPRNVRPQMVQMVSFRRIGMEKQYICDDRNNLEDVQKIRNMTDEEWDKYVKMHKETRENDKAE